MSQRSVPSDPAEEPDGLGRVLCVLDAHAQRDRGVTLGVYAHLFAQRDHAEAARDALEASFAALS